jgi:hypothetical protein
MSDNASGNNGSGKHDQLPAAAIESNLVAWEEWLNSIRIDRSTGYRYRKRGLIQVVNIFGRLYLTREEIARFESRAVAGEFALKRTTPFGRTPAQPALA